MSTPPNFYDSDNHIEAFVFPSSDVGDGPIQISLPSNVWIEPDVAEKFGRALIELAEWVRRRPSGGSPHD